MQPRTLQFIAEACSGQIQGLDPSLLVDRLCTDSRSIRKGDFFLALAGENFDGHDFVAEVMARGAIGAVTARNRAAGQPSIAVESPREALGRIAARYRRDFDLAAIAVAGSNGKTTTKELLASVLRQKFPTVASAGSFNNDVGVPLTLLEIGPEHRAGVFEAGTNHPGELRPLLEMIRPSIGILTSIGREHLEFFGDLDGVLREEGELADVLPAEGLLVLNGESHGLGQLRARTRARVMTVGFQSSNDWQIEVAQFDAEGTHFQLRGPKPEFSGRYSIRLLGAHQALNAALAVAVAAELGLSSEQIQAGLLACPGAKMRLQLRRIDDFVVLDDAYNANADSMNAALDTLTGFPCPRGRRIAVLGDMAELGAATAPAHEEIGRRAAEKRVDLLISVGKHAGLMAEAARGAGLRDIVISPGAEQAGPAVRERVRPGDVVLVKASRSSRLERVIEHLAEHFGAK